MSPGVNFTCNDVLFISPDEGWMVGTNRTILHTTDAGLHWQSQCASGDEPIRQLEHAGNRVYAVGWNLYYYDTTDPDAGWVQCPDGGFFPNVIGFSDALHGYAIEEWSSIGRLTSDGGLTWTKTPFPVDGTWIAMQDTLHGWTWRNDSIVHTNDGGHTWIDYPVAKFYDWSGVEVPMPFAEHVRFTTPSHGVLTDRTGGIFITDDGGFDWFRTTDAFTSANLTDIESLSPTVSLATAMDGAIYRTPDAGAHWDQVLSPDAPPGRTYLPHMHGISLLPNGRGWAVGERLDSGHVGVVMRTATGTNWTEQHLPPGTPPLYDVWTNNGVEAWASGQGVIVHTSDGGATWKRQPTSAGAYDDINDIKVFPSGEGWAVGLWDLVLHTDDFGTTWTRVSIGPLSIGASEFVDASTVFLGGRDGVLHMTHDGGSTWETRSFGGEITAVKFWDANHGVLWSGGMYQTSDGGATWDGVSVGYGQTIRAFSGVGQSAWAVGDGGEVLYNGAGGDYVAPSTMTNIKSKWVNTDFTVRLRGVDNIAVDSTHDRRDIRATLPGMTQPAFSAWSRFTRPRTVTAQGKTRFQYYTRDAQGNVEAVHTATVKIDKGMPKWAISPRLKNQSPLTTLRKGKTITVRGSDMLSGVARISIEVGGKGWYYMKSTTKSKFVYKFKHVGKTSIYFSVTDRAGNVTGKSYLIHVRK